MSFRHSVDTDAWPIAEWRHRSCHLRPVANVTRSVRGTTILMHGKRGLLQVRAITPIVHLRLDRECGDVARRCSAIVASCVCVHTPCQECTEEDRNTCYNTSHSLPIARFECLDRRTLVALIPPHTCRQRGASIIVRSERVPIGGRDAGLMHTVNLMLSHVHPVVIPSWCICGVDVDRCLDRKSFVFQSGQ